MKVDFDGLRIRMARTYNTLCRKVIELENPIEREDLSITVDDLRTLVVTLICLESEAEGFKALEDVVLGSVEEEGDEDEY